MTTPRFTLVLSSTDRPALLPAAVEAALASEFTDIEVIVSDNHSRIPAAELLAKVSDPRLRILRTERRIPVSDHWEFIWGHVRGEYAMYLGDDNALHPEILSLADAAIRAHGLDVVSWRAVTYFHPDWDIQYPPLPDRGNILGVDLGSSGRLYRADPKAVLRAYAAQLRLSACFPCMLNFLFRREAGEEIVRRTGKLFWAPNPDIASTVFVLATIPADRYGWFDRFGAIGGRSVDSNLASLLSRGKRSRRVYDYVSEFGSQDFFPHHEPKFVAISNALAATLSQGTKFFPDAFREYGWAAKTLALRTIDDMYVDCTVPWVDDASFVSQVESYLRALPAAEASECLAYRDRKLAEFHARESPPPAAPPSLRQRLSRIKAGLQGAAKRLLYSTEPQARDRWISGGTTYVDMASQGESDIAGAARRLPELLRRIDTRSDAFATQHRTLGFLKEELALPGSDL